MIDFVDGEIENFIYGVKAEGEKEFVRCEKSGEFEDEEFKGVLLVFEDNNI